MSAIVRIGPKAHGSAMTLDELDKARRRPGYIYELIDGKLYVSPRPNVPEDLVEQWLLGTVLLYGRKHPKVCCYVTNKAGVFVMGRPGVTLTKPDLAVYYRFPLHRGIPDLRWQDISPRFVAEVLCNDDPGKDLVRNVELYLEVPTIKEYWMLDGRRDPRFPSMRVYRRHGKSWRTIEFAGGETYTTKLLPGFKLTLDTRP